MTLQIAFLICTYFISSIPFGLLLSKIFSKKDIREYGSKNIGATNVTRILGKKLGLATLILDGVKGALMILLANYIFFSSDNLHYFLILVAAIAILGHIFPIYLKFKGGKGIATTIAVFIALNPMIGILVSLSWIIVFLIFRVSAIASLASVFMTIPLSYFFSSDFQFYFCILLFLLITYRHKDNISRLNKGKENKFKNES